MTSEKPESKTFATYRDVYERACKARSAKDAAKLLDQYALWVFENSEEHISMVRANEIARGNIGYLLGYGAPRRVIEIWEEARAHHPVFGQLSKLEKSPQEIMEMGARAAKKVSNKRK
jgi:hypothetical protein